MVAVDPASHCTSAADTIMLLCTERSNTSGGVATGHPCGEYHQVRLFRIVSRRTQETRFRVYAKDSPSICVGAALAGDPTAGGDTTECGSGYWRQSPVNSWTLVPIDDLVERSPKLITSIELTLIGNTT